MRRYEYEEFVRDIKILAAKTSGFHPDVIAFIARGGATMAHFLACSLDVRTMRVINAVSYEGDKKLGAPMIDLNVGLEGAKKVLVVDEIVDTGETLKAVMDALKIAYPDAQFASASLFQRESAIIKADYFISFSDEWIEFFWERF